MSSCFITIEQLRWDWSERNASSEGPTVPLHTEGGAVSKSPQYESQVLSLSRSITPDRFVREVEKCYLAASNFRGAVSSKSSKDTVDLKSQYPFGYRLITDQGWENRCGLSPDESGIQAPLDEKTLAHAFTDRESFNGLGYTTKTCSKIPGNGNPTAPSSKQTNTSVDPASGAWHQYAADLRAGDLTAKSDYIYDVSATLPREAEYSHSLRMRINGNVKTIVQDQYVINDKWRDDSSAPRIKKSVAQKIPRTTAETTPRANHTFVLDRNGNGFIGW